MASFEAPTDRPSEFFQDRKDHRYSQFDRCAAEFLRRLPAEGYSAGRTLEIGLQAVFKSVFRSGFQRDRLPGVRQLFLGEPKYEVDECRQRA